MGDDTVQVSGGEKESGMGRKNQTKVGIKGARGVGQGSLSWISSLPRLYKG